ARGGKTLRENAAAPGAEGSSGRPQRRGGGAPGTRRPRPLGARQPGPAPPTPGAHTSVPGPPNPSLGDPALLLAWAAQTSVRPTGSVWAEPWRKQKAPLRPGGGSAGWLRQKDKETKDKGRSCKTRTTTVSSHTPCRPGQAHGRTGPDGCPASPGPCRPQRRAEAPLPGRPRAALQAACPACRRRRCCAPAACACCWRA
uniref:Uncharacterized protein n=1 Tax=Mustela putorius furo TaxID=9669 RepID=M3YMX5_MUSPF